MTFGSLLASFHGKRILVVGDVMLDEYLYGAATRISPEAPVMVFRQDRTASRPGAGANVAANLVALGATVEVIGIVGTDAAGDTLSATLLESGLSHHGMVRDPSRPTTRKTRVLSHNGHQVLRIDHESTRPVEGAVEAEFLARALAELDQSDAVLISDYLKGAVTPSTLQTLIQTARAAGKPIVANAKPKSLLGYAGASLVSLNRTETADFLRRESLPIEETGDAATEVRSRIGVDHFLLTLSEAGMVAASERALHRVSAIPVEVSDPAGAGDTVIATIALGMAVGQFGQTLMELAAQTAAAVVRKVGVAVPSREDLDLIASS